MDTILVFGLAGAAAVNSAVPGPCILVASSRAATDGLWSGFRVTFGIALSDVILLALVWTMILGVLTLPGATQEILRLGGLALLVILALAMLAACLFSARVLRTGRQMARRVSRLCGGALLGFAALTAAMPV